MSTDAPEAVVTPLPAPTVPSVAIAIPANGLVPMAFARDLALLMTYMSINYPEIRIRLLICEGTLVHEARHKLVRAALANEDVTHILWIDSDMRFPKDCIIRMLNHQKPIVATNYSTRKEPHIPTAGINHDDDLLFDSTELEPLVRVERCGMGLMLVEANFFRAVQAPWFAVGFSPAADGYSGEDVYFCQLVARAGLDVVVDTQLSREISHIGSAEFQLDHCEITRQAFLLKHPEYLSPSKISPKIILNGT